MAAFLRVSKSWVYHQAAAGLLPHIKIGALVRFDPTVIRAHVTAPANDQGRAGSATIRSVR